MYRNNEYATTAGLKAEQNYNERGGTNLLWIGSNHIGSQFYLYEANNKFMRPSMNNGAKKLNESLEVKFDYKDVK